jgi:predicted RNase H-like HicB family nuclease
MDKQTVEVDVRRDASGYWAQVNGLEGCFATGESLDELVAALSEAIAMYVGEQASERLLTRVVGLRLVIEPDLRPQQDPPTSPPPARSRQTHRDDWPPRQPRARHGD